MIAEKHSGFLLVNKPKGVTSFHSIAPLKRYFKPQKIGFAGTLDPDATGLLLVGIGRATRLLKYMELLSKTYTVDVLPGKISDTYDVTGKIKEVMNFNISLEKVEEKLIFFRGRIEQTPPEYSAIKINGKRACDRVRNGEQIELKPREVEIFSLTLANWTKKKFNLTVHCSKGTYIRSLVHDLGQRLGCGAVASNISRTKIGTFNVTDSISPDTFNPENYLLPMEVAVPDLSKIYLYENFEEEILHGRFVSLGQYNTKESLSTHSNSDIAIYNHENQLIAIGKMDEDGNVRPNLVLAESSKKQIQPE